MRGLLCIEPLYHAIVSGKKTQTRRAGAALNSINKNPDKWKFTIFKHDYDDITNPMYAVFRSSNIHDRPLVYPLYKIGEVLYLKEPIIKKPDGCISYYYDMYKPTRDGTLKYAGLKKNNKLFMPASAARAFIKITGIKCERLLDISDEDCIAEGIEASGYGEGYYINYLMDETYGYDYLDNTPKESFISLYKLANKLAKRGSVPPHGQLPTPPGVDNTWVWVYTFEYLPNYKP